MCPRWLTIIIGVGKNDLSDQRNTSTTEEVLQGIEGTRLDQSNVLDWKVSSILLKTKFILSHVMLKYRCRSSIWFGLCRFELNPTVNNGDMSIEKYYSVIPMQPEVPFSTTTVENLKWFGHELTGLWIDKSSNKERICIYLAIDPKGQRDLQCHMIFDMSSTSYGLPRSLWPIVTQSNVQ